MKTFIIGNDDGNMIDSPVIYAGDKGRQEAIAVFTDARATRRFLEAAGWQNQFSILRLVPNQLRGILKIARDDGVHFLVLNPERPGQFDGSRVNVLALESPINDVVASIFAAVP